MSEGPRITARTDSLISVSLEMISLRHWENSILTPLHQTEKFRLDEMKFCPTTTLDRIGIRTTVSFGLGLQIGDSRPNSDHICISHYRWPHDGLTCSHYRDPVYAYGLIVIDQSVITWTPSRGPGHLSHTMWAHSSFIRYMNACEFTLSCYLHA
jgi:hypothetical protein